MSLQDDLERIGRWERLMDEAPGEAREVIRERFLQSEAIAPIVEAWKRKVAELEQDSAALQQQLLEARTEIDEAKRALLLTREQDREGFERLHRQAADIAQKTAALLDELDTLREQIQEAKKLFKGWLFVTGAKDNLFVVKNTKAWLQAQEAKHGAVHAED